ncbi:uncharacterized protein [Haliotis cracherodii]|uniref:uncharacterized protein n=1 Tax=Haliotis cracherodii TaxID=6455 RepID=UPI0039E7F55D
MARPVKLPKGKTVVTSLDGKVHPLRKRLNLTAFLLSGQYAQTEAFLRMQRVSSPVRGVLAPGSKAYTAERFIFKGFDYQVSIVAFISVCPECQEIHWRDGQNSDFISLVWTFSRIINDTIDISSEVDKAMKAQKLDVSNLALRKPTYGCTDYDKYSNPNHVVDGNTGGYRKRGQCFTSAKSVFSPWWMVDLQDIYDVHNVTLYGRKGGHAKRFRDLEILVYQENPFENKSSQPMTCAQKKGKLSRPDVLTCNPSTTGRFVVLQYIKPNKNVFTVCEVEVGGKLFKGRKDVSNLALRKPTYGCTDYDKYSNPNHVVDGNTGGYRKRGQCFTSAKSVLRPWWMVDLQDIYDVHNVTLYGRTGGHAKRFRDLEILVYQENPFENKSSQPMTCAQKKGKLSRPDVLTCNPSTTGRFVLLQYIKPNKKVLTVCEVEVGGKLFKGRKAAIVVKSKDVSNLALRKPTHGCTDYDKYSNPNHVVDGNTGGYRKRGQCFTSAKSVLRPWWMVDLQDIYDVHNVTLYGRTGGHAKRFRDLEILVYQENPFENNSSQLMTCAQKKGKLSRPDVLTCNPSTTGRFVLLQYIKPNKKVLTVCEVEVRGKLFKD